jgi:hypothetical protein
LAVNQHHRLQNVLTTPLMITVGTSEAGRIPHGRATHALDRRGASRKANPSDDRSGQTELRETCVMPQPLQRVAENFPTYGAAFGGKNA